MNSDDAIFHVKDFLIRDMQIISVKVRDLTSPISAIRFCIEDMMEDPLFEKYKDHIAGLAGEAGKCVAIVRELAELTLPYFELKAGK